MTSSAFQVDHYTKIRLVITLPARITKLLALSTEQQAQLRAISNRFESDVLSAEQEKQRAFAVLQQVIMKADFAEGAVKQRQDELVAANAKRVSVIAEMLAEMSKTLTSEQMTRVRSELPIERNDPQLIVQLPEGLSDIGLSHEQDSQLLTVVRSRQQQMFSVSRKEQAARKDLEQAIFTEQSEANQRQAELIAILSEQVELNTGILLEARQILTPDQLKRLAEMTPNQ